MAALPDSLPALQPRTVSLPCSPLELCPMVMPECSPSARLQKVMQEVVLTMKEELERT
jgi:hypothetical protein